MRPTTVLLAILLLVPALKAQETDGRTFLSAEVGGGYTRFLSDMDVDGLDGSGFAGMLRLMWNPEHLLSLGQETGYQHLYSVDRTGVPTEFGATDFSASMYAESFAPFLDFGWSSLRSLREGRWKYIAAPRAELYDVVADPAELRNRLAERPAEGRALQTRLDRISAPELNALKRAVQVLTARAQNQQDQDNRYAAALRLAALATTELQAAEVKVIREVAVQVLREMVTFNQQAAEARRALEELGAESSGRSRPAVEGGDSLESEGGH